MHILNFKLHKPIGYSQKGQTDSGYSVEGTSEKKTKVRRSRFHNLIEAGPAREKSEAKESKT